jgi:hypothetical protein
MKRILAASMLAISLSAVSVSPALAGRDYTDEDTEVLSIAATFLRPVGLLLEAIVFRPLHTLSHKVDPHDGISDRPVRSCRSLRPRRDCSSRH